MLRADSGFAREALMAWCEENRVDYLFGLARNDRLVAEIDERTGRGGGGERRDRAAGPALQGLHVDDARQLELPPSGRRQGRAYPGRGQSALRRHLAQPRSAPTPGRSTRTSTAPAARWRTASRNASSICSPTAPRPPPCGPTSFACGSPRWPMCCSTPCAASASRRPARRCHLRLHPPQAPQDRRPGPHLRPPRQDRHDLRPSLAARLGARPRRTRRRALTRTRQRTVDITTFDTAPRGR